MESKLTLYITLIILEIAQIILLTYLVAKKEKWDLPEIKPKKDDAMQRVVSRSDEVIAREEQEQ